VSELSDGAVQSTTLPFEYVCRTWNMTVPGLEMLALKRNTESRFVGVRPPVHATLVTVALLPDPVVCVCILQGAGEGSNESMEKFEGTVNSILFVIAFASSVGTESVNCCNVSFAFATAGLMIACADAIAASTNAAAPAPPSAMPNLAEAFMPAPFEIPARTKTDGALTVAGGA
jgi:hypothetical protein